MGWSQFIAVNTNLLLLFRRNGVLTLRELASLLNLQLTSNINHEPFQLYKLQPYNTLTLTIILIPNHNFMLLIRI